MDEAAKEKPEIVPAIQRDRRRSEFYDRFKPLNADDVSAIREAIDRLLSDSKYQDDEWAI